MSGTQHIFIAAGGDAINGVVGLLVFGLVALINVAIAASKKQQREATERQAKDLLSQGDQSRSAAAGSPSQMPFKTLGGEVAARRARMTTMDQNRQPNRPAMSLNQALAEAVQAAQATRRAKGQPKVPPAKMPAKRVAKQTRQRSAPPSMPLAAPMPARSAQRIAASAALPSSRPDISASEIRSVTEKSKIVLARADAASIKRWLTPATLQQQFMLTEVLNRPVSLRD